MEKDVDEIWHTIRVWGGEFRAANKTSKINCPIRKKWDQRWSDHPDLGTGGKIIQWQILEISVFFNITE